MFTGIIESVGKVIKIKKYKNNIDFFLTSSLTNKLSPKQSLSHNGVCLTIVDKKNDNYRVTAIDETLKKTNLKYLKIGSLVNLERSLKVNDRFDGHIVQGHIDDIGLVKSIKNKNGSYYITITYKKSTYNTIEKGSIAVNGISLTIINSIDNSFSIEIIPYTWDNTNINQIKENSKVNLEFDIIGKYIKKLNNSYRLLK